MKTKISLLFILFVFTQVFSQTITPGERLEYKISYIGITLANAFVHTEKVVNVNGVQTYQVKAEIRTPSGMPFIDAYVKFISNTQRDLERSQQFIRHIKLNDGEWEYQKLFFDYYGQEISNKKWINQKLMHSSRYGVNSYSKIHDIISLVFNIRNRSYQKDPYNLYAIIDQGIFDVYINKTGIKESTDVGFVDYPVRCRYVAGNANWRMYGMTGFAEAWFSDDKARIPVKAYVDLRIGKAKIELVKWNRPGWKAPYGK
jgi:hypothetical protein